MFAAARDEDGIWRLSIRRIRIIKTTARGEGQIAFSSQAKAKACADELNTTKYEEHFDKRTGNPISDDYQNVQQEVLSIINKHTK